jgi:phage baseplate assembly protein gpV
MFKDVINYINNRLFAYDEKITELLAKVEDLERRTRNVIQAGRVTDIHPDGQRIRVAFGDNKTPFISWFSSSAGAVREYRCPSVGEQCVLLNYGGGETSAQSWALTGMPSGQFPAAESNKDIHVIDWGGGMKISIDTVAGSIKWTVPQELIIDTPKITSTAELTTDGDQIANGVSTVLHIHTGIKAGGDTSGAPV